MRARRFEEVLEECVTAHLEGRRSVEESLSLYPSLARELEPILRTATGVVDAFQAHTPSHHAVERGRYRFLLAASTRTRARALTARLDVSEHRSQPWGVRIWGSVGTAAASVIAAVAVTATVLTSGGGQAPGAVSNGGTDGPAPAVINLADLQATHERLKSAASQGGQLEPDLQHIQEVTVQIQDIDPSALTGEQLEQLKQTIQEQYILLHNIQESTPPDQPAGDVREILGSTEDLAAKWGVKLPVFSPLPSDTPVPTLEPTAEPTQAPVETPAPTLPPVPTPEPTPAATPAPAEGPAGQASPPPVFEPS